MVQEPCESPRGPADLRGSTPQELHDVVQTWLRSQRSTVADRFLAGGSASTATVKTRAAAKALPIYRDLAPDVIWALDQIESMLDRALDAIEDDENGPEGYEVEGPIL